MKRARSLAAACVAVLAFYAEDAVLLPPGEAAIVGRAAIRPRYEALFRGFDPAIACERDRPLDDAFLMVLARDASGRMRITHLAWHRADPEPPR